MNDDTYYIIQYAEQQEILTLDETEEYAISLREAFGRHSKRCRQDLDLSQREIADRMGVSQRSISLLERGEMNLTISTMAKISRLLGVPVPAMLQPYKTASGGSGS